LKLEPSEAHPVSSAHTFEQVLRIMGAR
jgi:hypothetical protein